MDSASLDALEDIVTCPIHYGFLENPRILSCGHALCKACLDAILAHNMARCPICKTNIGVDGDRSQCFVLSQVSEFLSKREGRRKMTNSCVDPPKPKFPIQLTSEMKNEDKSINMMRWNMAQEAHYKSCHEVLRIRGSSHSEMQKSRILCVSEDLHHSYVFVLFDNNSSILRLSVDGCKSAPFHLQMHPEESFEPHFLKCFRGKIYLAGVLTSTQNPTTGIMLQANSDGVIVKRSSPFHLNSGNHPPINGFDIDPVSGEVAVTCPNSHAVHLLSCDLENIDVYVIDDPPMAPYFVAKSANDLWVTCPQDSRILIINIPTGQLEYLFAEEIFDCIPSHIARTTDDRIVVLDSQDTRVFWLQRKKQNMIAQTLILGKEVKRKEVSSIGTGSDACVLVGTRDCIFFLKPKLHREQPSLCAIL